MHVHPHQARKLRIIKKRSRPSNVERIEKGFLCFVGFVLDSFQTCLLYVIRSTILSWNAFPCIRIELAYLSIRFERKRFRCCTNRFVKKGFRKNQDSNSLFSCKTYENANETSSLPTKLSSKTQRKTISSRSRSKRIRNTNSR